MLFAQSSTLTGVVSDSASGKPLAAVTLYLYNADSSKTFNAFSDVNGKYSVIIPQGSYTLEANSLGYRRFKEKVDVFQSTAVFNFSMAVKDRELSKVKVEAEVVPVQMKGDTAEFNAQAYKTNPNASAKDLVGKMPGMQTNGDVKAEGENVQQVLVDGKPFFGQDANTALSTLPATVVDKIQVFDDQSEQSKQSGVDDGTRVKTINIVTKINMRNGEFGRVYAGYGTDNRYSAGGNVNIFRGDQRVSILGQFNNINQQNFGTEDLLGVTGDNSERRGPRWHRGFSVGSDASDFMVNTSNGVTQTLAGGLNYQNVFSPKFEMSGSYFYNRGNSYSLTNTFQNYYLTGDAAQQYNELDSANALNTNHRLTAKLHYKHSDQLSIFMLPAFSMQINEGSRLQTGSTLQEGFMINQLNQLLNTELSALNWSNDLMIRKTFDKKGRMLFLSVEAGQGFTTGVKNLDATSMFNGNNQVILQQADLDNRTLAYEIDVRYSEPLNDKGLGLDLSYELSNDKARFDKYTYDELNAFNRIDSLSNVFNTDWLAHEYGIGLRKFDKGSGFVVRARVEVADLINNQDFPFELSTDKRFISFVPFALYRKSFKDKSNVFVMYRTGTDAPSASQLQNVLDNSNPLQLSIGNTALIRQYEHMLRMRYRKTNPTKGTMIYFALNGTYSDNYLANTTFTAATDTVYNGVQLGQGTQLNSFANLKGYRQYSGFFTYGFPMKLIKSNVNLNLSSSYSDIPALINDIETFTVNQNHQLGIDIASNISEYFDFSIGTETSYNISENSQNSRLNSQYWIQSSNVRVDYITQNGFTFRTSLNHQVYSGLSSSLDNDVLLWNLGIGKQIFENKQGEIQISVFDLLAQNNAISQQFYSSYYQEQTSNVMTRYVMLSFSYNFRVFREAKANDEAVETEE